MPTTNLADALKFLAWLNQKPDIVYTLPGMVRQYVSCDDDVRKVLELHQSTYYSIAVVHEGVTKKAAKAELFSTQFLHCDLDPTDGLEIGQEMDRLYERLTVHLPGNVPEPTAIVESGRGYQALWKLKEPIALPGGAAGVEAANRWLAQQLGGDSVHDVTRVFRLPGSWNALDDKKIARGYQPRQTSLVSIVEDRLYTLSDFGTAKQVPKSRSATAGAGQTTSGTTGAADADVVHYEVDDITDPTIEVSDIKQLAQYKLPLRILWLIGRGTPSASLDDYEREFGSLKGRRADDQSAWLYDVNCQCLRSKVPHGLILGLITDRRWAISGHCLADDRDPEYCARRQIARAMNTVSRDVPKQPATQTPPNSTSQQEDEDSDEWYRNGTSFEDFDRSEKKVAYWTMDNVNLGLLAMNLTVKEDLLKSKIRVSGLEDKGYGEWWSDGYEDYINIMFHERYLFSKTGPGCLKFVKAIAHHERYHPVTDYLDTLKWDKVERLDSWLIDTAGAEDTAFVRAVSSLVLIAAVRRVREPGCKFDELVILQGHQGGLKSSALQCLVPVRTMFGDSLPIGAGGRETLEATQGKWIIEVAELEGFGKRDHDACKAFLSRDTDEGRMAYARSSSEVPRQWIAIATVNHGEVLSDDTGNRRYWPIHVGTFDIEKLKAMRDQLWAEASVREKMGVSIRLDKSLWDKASIEQEKFSVTSPLHDRLAVLLEGLSGRVRPGELWNACDVSMGQRTRTGEMKKVMADLGWAYLPSARDPGEEGKKVSSAFSNGGKEWFFSHKDSKSGRWHMLTRSQINKLEANTHQQSMGGARDDSEFGHGPN